MAHGKELFLHGSLYNFLWAKTFQYLHDAEEIFFIGYGFPETDINNLLYFSDPYLKRKIEKIVVLYRKNVKQNLKRLGNLFGPEKIINMDAKQFIKDNIFQFNHYHPKN